MTTGIHKVFRDQIYFPKMKLRQFEFNNSLPNRFSTKQRKGQQMNLNKIRRQFFKILPKAIRSRLLRQFMPPVSLDIDNVMLRPAETFDHYIKSFRLVHDVYVEAGYIDPSPTALRVLPQHFHKDSRIFLGVYCAGDQEVPVYTLSIFPDSKEVGLPMDEAFKLELDILRREGRFIAEVGCLASDPFFRKNDMNIPMLGNRILQLYARKHLNVDDLVITTHPKFLWVYEDILLFEKIGEVKAYAYVKNNPAVALRLNLRTAAQRYKKVYGSKPKEKNLYHFFNDSESNSTYLPPIEQPQALQK